MKLNWNRCLTGLALVGFSLLSSCAVKEPTLSAEWSSPNRSIASADRKQVEEVLRAAVDARSSLSKLGNPRANILGDFISATRVALADKSNEAILGARVKSLFGVYKALSNHKEIVFFTGKESPSVEQLFRNFEAAGENLDARMLYSSRARVSFLRYQSNRTARAILNLTRGEDMNPAELKNAIGVQNGLVKVTQNIATMSTIADTPSLLSERARSVTNSNDYKNLLALAKTAFFRVRDSSEIDGGEVELENVTAVTVGVRVLEVLFSEILNDRSPASLAGVSEPSKLGSLDPQEVTILDSYQAPLKLPTRKPAQTKAPADLILVGLLPGKYLKKDETKFFPAVVAISNRVITEVREITADQVEAVRAQYPNKSVIVLKGSKGMDVMYPGIIDLHDHTKQNNLPVWGQALGQFENRFEWRAWGNYDKAVSQNMNPWIQFGKPVECAAFRWSELQSMVAGTTYLQGPSTCVSSFGILRVEDKDSFISKKAAVQAPTDIVIPNDFQFVWAALKPLIDSDSNKKGAYERALAKVVLQHCPSLKGVINEKSVASSEGLAILGNQAKLLEACPNVDSHPPKFIRYVYWLHPGLMGKKKYLESPTKAAVVGHLAEGNRTDLYNRREYELLKLIGLNLPNINFVHGVGVEAKNYPELAANQIGIVWSPFSNLILYGQTLDILAAQKAGVRLALGSDWLPTGTKGPLEEVKVAAHYVDQVFQDEKSASGPKLNEVFTDRVLFEMLTENPAKMISHWENTATERGVGQIAVGSMGSLIVTSLLDANPYTNLVRKVREPDVNLTIIDGMPVYGNAEYLDQVKLKYETISELDSLVQGLKVQVDTPPTEKGNWGSHLAKLGRAAASLKFPPPTGCDFSSKKGFVLQSSGEPTITQFEKDSGLNLDRFEDIQRLLALNVLTQSINLTAKDGDPKSAVTYFPSLYSCHDSAHSRRVEGQVRAKGGDDWEQNRKSRKINRDQGGLGNGPAKLAEIYK
jgi:cytosine/adenosine deaminase-related metal-dependent hydrolase